MKNFLIVFNNVVLLSTFKRWLSRLPKEQSIFLVKDSRKAVEVLNEYAIDVVITELELPEMSGIELAAYTALHYPLIKMAFFLPTELVTESNLFKHFSSLYFVFKISSLKDFIRLIRVMKVVEFQANAWPDIKIIDFLKLIEYQKQTCLLEITNCFTEQQGVIYFEKGVLYDATCADLTANVAAVEICSWQQSRMVQANFSKKNIRRTIQLSLSTLMAQKDCEKEVCVVVVQNETENAAPLFSRIEEASTARVEVLEQVAILSLEEESVILDVQQADFSKKMQFLVGADILQTLQTMNNYCAFAIFDKSGKIVFEDNVATFLYPIEKITKNTEEMIKVAVEMMPKMNLGEFRFVQISSDGAVFQIDWVIENQLLAIVLLNEGATNTGLAKIHLDKACQLIRYELTE